jgi:hypothetical protein
MQEIATEARGRKSSDDSQFYVSTGHLPSGKVIDELVMEAQGELFESGCGDRMSSRLA